MTKCNLDIRQQIKEAGLPLWAVADRLGIADTTFSKWLRKELPKEKKQEILAVTEDIKRETKA
jgi:transposase-like protein